MNTNMLKRVRKNFPKTEMTPYHVTRHNQRQWVKSVRHLGNKWLLAEPIHALSTSRTDSGETP